MTFNQRDLLTDALESFFEQETRFPVEIVVQDDASTDGTHQLIRQYAEKYPGVMRPVFREQNTRSVGQSPLLAILKHCRGEFIAMCEGDDYWTNARKLQVQVDFLRANPDCVGCIHDARVVDNEEKTLMESCINRQAARYTQRDCVEWLLSGYPTASLVFRREPIRCLPDYFQKCARDVTLDIAITEHGDLGVLDANMSVYRKHADGIWTGASAIRKHVHNLGIFLELFQNDSLRCKYEDCLRNHLRICSQKICREAEAALAVKQSLSWRLTKPLRFLQRLFDPGDNACD